MNPEVRHLIPCDNVEVDPQNLHRLNVVGLMSYLRSRATPPFPAIRPHFCVLAILTGCQGAGELSVRIMRAETNEIIFATRPRTVIFSGTVSALSPFKFNIQNCRFPAAGLYWVETIFSQNILGRQAMIATSVTI
jgi:hypothetical protein